jgi:hypothetical protein
MFELPAEHIHSYNLDMCNMFAVLELHKNIVL